MKFFAAIVVFLFSSFVASAQYGKLEPLRDYDTLNFVLRTPKAVIAKMLAGKDEKQKRQAKLIQSVERQLEVARNGYTIRYLPAFNTTSFTRNLQMLTELGVDPGYYLREYFIYYPKTRERVNQTP